MRKPKNQVLLSIISILIITVAIAVMICDWAVPLNIFMHPVLTFFMIVFGGFGILCYALGGVKKSSGFFLAGAFQIGLVIIYVLICVRVYWYIALIVMLSFWTITGIVTFLVCGNKTEEIALNKSSNYKDYKQRNAEQQKDDNTEKEELPEIKSFKN